MGKLKEFQIRLASDKLVYQAGEVISGELVARLESSIEVKGIKLRFRGKGYVHWSEQRHSGKTTYTVHYYGRHELFNQIIYVLGKEDGDEKISLSQGEHIYPFSFQLPEELPTSYEDHIGHVRYEITANIQRPWKIDPKTRRVFTVLSRVDLNHVENALLPAEGNDTKYLCCWCCESGPIKAEMRADRSAYVPGEFVTINATLKNKSKSKVKATSASIVQVVHYHARGKSRTVGRTVATIEGPKCKGGKTIEWTNKRIQIPPVPPTSRGVCRVLDIEYFVMFQAHLRTCAVDLREREPITIGTVPLRSLDMYQNTGAGEVQTSLSNPQAQTDLPSVVADEPSNQTTFTPTTAVPPRAIYKASTAGAINLAALDDEGKTLQESSYTNQYTFYDWSQTAFTY